MAHRDGGCGGEAGFARIAREDAQLVARLALAVERVQREQAAVRRVDRELAAVALLQVVLDSRVLANI